MFGWEFPPHISGGLGTACFGITRGLSAIAGVKILFVVPKAYGDENPGNVRIIAAGDTDLAKRPDLLGKIGQPGSYLEVKSRLVPYVSPEAFEKREKRARDRQEPAPGENPKGKLEFSGSYGTNLFTEISDYALTAEIIAREQEFDIIHAHDWLTYQAGIAAKRISGKPLVVHVHATDFDRSGGKVNPRVFEIERAGMESADKVITVSNLTREAVIRRYNIAAERVVTVYNAVDPLQQGKASFPGKGYPEKTVTFLGRITIQKGPEYFVKAAELVLRKMKTVRFVMAGSGDMKNEMLSLVSRLGISDRFHFPGFLVGEAVRQLLYSSDVFVMPSVSEPFGISPLEAMQAGVPVIISRQSGVSELLSHAIKVDYWDVEAMADAIYAILNYKALARMLAENGEKQAGQFRWEDSARHIHSIYKSLLVA